MRATARSPWIVAAALAAASGCLHDWDSIAARTDPDGGVDGGLGDDAVDATAADATAADAMAAEVPAADDVPIADDVRMDGGSDAPSPDASDDATVARDADAPDADCGARALCAEACVNLETDVSHCGACDSACPAVLNGVAACRASVCGALCRAGFAALPERDCATFGGATSASANGEPCRPNPDGRACACPAGFGGGPSYALRARAEAAPAVDFESRLTLCQVPALATAGEWGGSYVARTAAPPLATDCAFPNAYTGRCSCPVDQAEAQLIPVQIDPRNRPVSLVLCARPAATVGTPRSYLGAYAVLLGGYVTPAGRTPCLSPNPITGGCSCPAGAREVTARSMGNGVLHPATTVSTTAPAMIHVCVR